MTATATPTHVVLRPEPSPRRFLDAQRVFYRGDPHYVPPLTLAETWQIDPRKNEFFRRAEATFVIAERGGEVVGRISAVRNSVHDEFHGDRVGFFGHFEAADEDAAGALLDHAASWLKERGAERIRGPIDLSTNYRCGLWIDGEPGPPVLMMPHNPKVYADWLGRWGLRKSKDLLALMLEERTATIERFDRMADKIRERTQAVIRPVRMDRFGEELDLLWRLYNRIWERNWGFVPMGEGEFRRSAKEMKPIAKAELLTIVEAAGEPVAFALNVPDLNVATKACNGRLLPFGWWRFLRALRRTQRSRVLTLGVLPEYRNNGIDALLLHYYARANPRLGYPQCEASWVLEDNVAMVRVLEKLGARVYRRYRVYEREL